MGTQGKSRPAPASARTQACSRSRKEDQARDGDGANTAPLRGSARRPSAGYSLRAMG